ncbi:autotransporter domain-containing protein [Castellaniella hirudinis]|uniref:Autotransporter domain-containing protein n=1 Tax=Castellaniella hirudinis TaxID=1144617 RepID=A0ABV8S1H1_9BURK
MNRIDRFVFNRALGVMQRGRTVSVALLAGVLCGGNGVAWGLEVIKVLPGQQHQIPWDYASGAFDGGHIYEGGDLINNQTLENKDRLANDGKIVNLNEIINRSELLNNGVFINYDVLINEVTGIIYNEGFLYRYSNVNTSGSIYNKGVLHIGAGGTTGYLDGNVLNEGELRFNRSDATTFDGVISGFGNVHQDGSGRLRLTGDSSGFSGVTWVDKGILSVDGRLGGGLIVEVGGRLQGIGTAGSVVTAVAGTIAPGHSIGTLNVPAILFHSGSTYEVEANAAGQSDRIASTGLAALGSGLATVQVLVEAGNYQSSTTYTILTATGGVTGTFKDVTSNLAFLTPSLSYDPNTVFLTLTRNAASFADIGGTPNQIAAGSGVESLGMGHGLHDAVLGLSADTARSAFDQLSGEIHAATRGVLIENSRMLRDAANDRLRSVQAATPAASTRAHVWAQAYGHWGRSPGDGNAATLRHDSQGLFFGVDRPLGDGYLGLMAGLGRSHFKLNDRNSSGSSDDYHLGLYGGTQWGDLALRAGAAHSWHALSSTRSVAMPGFTDHLKAEAQARTAQVFGELAYGIQAGRTRFEPYVNLAYVNVRSQGLTEHGGAAALATESETSRTTFSTLGVRAASAFELDSGAALSVTGTLGWRHAFGNTLPESTQGFAAGGTAFTVSGTPIARNSAVLEAGLDYRLKSNTTLGIAYTGQLASGAHDHGVRAHLEIRF